MPHRQSPLLLTMLLLLLGVILSCSPSPTPSSTTVPNNVPTLTPTLPPSPLPPTRIPATPLPTLSSTPVLLATDVVGYVTATDPYIFWHEDTLSRIFAYNLDDQKKYLVTETPAWKLLGGSDGTTLTWIEGTPADHIQGYDLQTGQEFTIVTAAQPDTTYYDSQMDNGVLYYYVYGEGQKGLFAFDLATKEDRFLAPGSSDFAVDGPMFLWNEYLKTSDITPTSSLYLTFLDSSQEQRMLVQDLGGARFFSVSGNYAVWNYYAQEVYLYDITQDTTVQISPGSAYYPVIAGTTCAWFEDPQITAYGVVAWPLVVYDITSGNRTILGYIEHPSRPQAWAIIRQNLLLYTLTLETGKQELYIVELNP